MPDAGSEKAGEIKRQELQGVLMDTLSTIKLRVLVRCHNRVLDIELFSQTADPVDHPEVDEGHSGRDQDHISVFLRQSDGSHFADV